MYRIRYNMGKRVMMAPQRFRKKAVANRSVRRAIVARRVYRKYARISNPRVVRVRK